MKNEYTRSKMPKVAIITRTKNRNILLERALESVLAQTYSNWVHVIVNDGGDQESLNKTLDAYIPRYADKIEVVHNATSLGMEAASNIGVKKCASDFIVIHDDDDSWLCDFLEKAVERLIEGNAHGVVCLTNQIIEKVDNQKVKIKKTKRYNYFEAVSLSTMLMENFFPPISFVFSRAVWEEIGGFDESLPVLGDWDFNIKFLRKYDIDVLPEFLANYHFRYNPKNSSYGNSVTIGLNKHLQIDTYIRNKYLREDICKGVVGIGTMMAIGRQNLDNRKAFSSLISILGLLKKIARKTGLINLYRRLV